MYDRTAVLLVESTRQLSPHDIILSGIICSGTTFTSRYSDGEHPLEAKLNELLAAQMVLKETVDKAVVRTILLFQPRLLP